MDRTICVRVDLINQKLLPGLLASIKPVIIAQFTVNRASSGSEVLGFLSEDGSLRALGRRATESLSTLTNAIRRSWFGHGRFDVARGKV